MHLEDRIELAYSLDECPDCDAHVDEQHAPACEVGRAIRRRERKAEAAAWAKWGDTIGRSLLEIGEAMAREGQR